MASHVSEFGVEWAHCDAAGIVFYPHYYTWFDQGTERLFSRHGLSYAELDAGFGICGMPLLETGASYKAACRLGDRVRLTTWLDGVAGKTFLMRHRLERADGALAAEGSERRIMVRRDPEAPSGIRAVGFPDEVRGRLQG